MQARGLINESSSPFSVDLSSVAAVIGMHDVPSNLQIDQSQVPASVVSNMPNEPEKPRIKLSQNQITALKKFPSLIDFIGSKNGEKIALGILEKINSIVVEDIENNTKKINKHAQACIAEKQNIKAIFASENEDWICSVTASGPFNGNEAFYFDEKEEASYILRIAENDTEDIEDVSSQFNKIHEFSRKEESEI